jgi:putative flippase GtrA
VTELRPLGSAAVESGEAVAATPALAGRRRAVHALRQPHNWVQLGKFCAVGAAGYVINLGVYWLLINAGVHYLLAAVCSFLVAVTNNYIWNRQWTFRGQRGHVGAQGARFLAVSLIALGANLLCLHLLIGLGLGKLVAQAIAIVLVTPVNFIGNKLWSFRVRRPGA